VTLVGRGSWLFKLAICRTPIAKQSGEEEVGPQDVGLVDAGSFSFDIMADSGGEWQKWGEIRTQGEAAREIQVGRGEARACRTRARAGHTRNDGKEKVRLNNQLGTVIQLAASSLWMSSMSSTSSSLTREYVSCHQVDWTTDIQLLALCKLLPCSQSCCGRPHVQLSIYRKLSGACGVMPPWVLDLLFFFHEKGVSLFFSRQTTRLWTRAKLLSTTWDLLPISN
jgi:hypothetical protein